MNNTKLKILQEIWTGDSPSTTDLAEETDTTRPNVQKHLNDLEERGLINVKKTQHNHIREVTEEGVQKLKDNLSDLQQVNRSGDVSGGEGDPFFLHFFSIICEYNNPDMLSEDWRERFEEVEEMEVEEHKDFDRIQLKSKEWVYRLTGRSIEVQIRNELTGKDVRSLKDRGWNKAVEGLEHLEQVLGESIPRDRMTLRLKSQHIGARRKHIAKAFIDHIDVNTELSPRNFRVLDEEDEIRIYCDKSGPGGTWEEESGNGGQVDGRMDTAEDDQQLLQDFTWSLLEDPDSTRRLADTPERVDSVEERVSSVEESVSRLSSAVEEGFEQVETVLEKNVVGGGQVQEQVTEVEQRQEKLESELQEISSHLEQLVETQEQSVAVSSRRSVSDEKIVEQLQQISEHIQGNGYEANGGTTDPVDKEIRNLLEDPAWSKPGLMYGHLMAWNVEEQSCERILHRRVVEKSESEMLDLVDSWRGGS